MPRIWKPLPKEFPADGATVWVTPSNQYNPPFQATFDLATFQFTDIVSSAVMPWWAIARWKPFIPPPTAFLADTFTGPTNANLDTHTPEIGGAWTKVFGTNDYLLAAQPGTNQSGGFECLYTNSAIPPTPNYSVQFEIDADPGYTDTTEWMARYDAATGDRYSVQITITGTINLLKTISGTPTTLDTAAFTMPSQTDPPSVINLAVNASALSVTVDGAPTLSATDTDITAAGIVGVHGNRFAGQPVFNHNLICTTI